MFSIEVSRSLIKSDKPTGDSEEVAKKRKKFKELVIDCVSLTKDLPKSRAYLLRILEAIDTFPITANIFGHESIIGSLGTECAAILKNVDGVNETASKPNDYCYVSVPVFNGGSAYQALSSSMYKVLLKTRDEKDDYLYDRMKYNIGEWNLNNANNSSGYSYSQDEEACSYSPFKTAELVEKLLKNKCVKTVYVPDPWLIKKIGSKGQRLILRPFETDDRFMVDLSETNCTEGVK